ncbi:MAG: hypothetical protein WED04_12975 [Promethearchaeati archaeon SRVP18_Atabeyarchaeia-1]
MQGFTHILAAGLITALLMTHASSFSPLFLLAAAFSLGILSHGVIDPFGRATFHPPDIPRGKETGARFWLPFHIFMYLAMAASIIWLVLAFQHYWWLIVSAMIGSMFPDIVDLGYRGYVNLRGRRTKRRTWSTSTEMSFHKYLCWPMEQVADRILPDLAQNPKAASVELVFDGVLVILLVWWLRVPLLL